MVILISLFVCIFSERRKKEKAPGGWNPRNAGIHPTPSLVLAGTIGHI